MYIYKCIYTDKQINHINYTDTGDWKSKGEVKKGLPPKCKESEGTQKDSDGKKTSQLPRC